MTRLVPYYYKYDTDSGGEVDSAVGGSSDDNSHAVDGSRFALCSCYVELRCAATLSCVAYVACVELSLNAGHGFTKPLLAVLPGAFALLAVLARVAVRWIAAMTWPTTSSSSV